MYKAVYAVYIKQGWIHVLTIPLAIWIAKSNISPLFTTFA